MRAHDPIAASGGAPAEGAGPAVMLPLLFAGCYGWLHLPAPAARRPSAPGVVLCNPFGQEAVMAHRGWRYLATQLAANGMPALRFDYHGTGDSLGEESDPARLRAWTQSIVAAVRELRAQTGVTRVALCGLRLGTLLATLATQALAEAADDGTGDHAGGGVEIEALVLLAPVVRGRDHLRELRALQGTAQATLADQLDPAETDAFMTVIGNRFYRETIEAIQATDFGKPGQLVRRPAARMLILSASPHDGAARLADAAAQLGCAVERDSFDEYGQYVSYPELNELPWQAFRRVTGWLAGLAPDAVRMPPHADVAPVAQAPVLQGEGFIEQRLHYGADGLFGILCEPLQARRGAQAPVVLIVNTGAGHHIGDARMGVRCARELARQGVASLRMDLGGIGDGVTLALPRYRFQPYGSALQHDVAAAASWLRAEGFGRVVVFGICSGAYVGLHATTACEHVAGALLVNVQRYIWPEGLGIQEVVQQRPGPRQASTRTYLAASMDPQKWVRVLRGEAEIGSIVRELARRVGRRVRARLGEAWAWACRADTPVRQVHRLFARLDARGVPVWLVYGGYDPGLGELGLHFGHRGRGLRRYRHVRLVLSDRVDHALRAYAARDAVMALLEAYLRTHFCVTPITAPSASTPAQPAAAPACQASGPLKA